MRVIDRGALSSPVAPGVVTPTTSRSGLPPEMLAAASERLAEIALIYAAIYLTQYIIASVVQINGAMIASAKFSAPWGILTAIFVTASVLVAALARSGRIPPEYVPDIGLLYMVVGALGIEIGLLWLPEDVPIQAMGLSWVVVWLAMYPLVVPCTPGKMLLAALAAAALRPLMLLILVARGAPAPETGLLVLAFFPSAIGVCLAVLGTRIIYGLGRDVSRARQLGSYQLIETLGRGGMGEVWRAEHGLLARPAAIKLIRPESLGQAEPAARHELLKRFEREARATAQLSSPHTIQVHDYGVTEASTFYYVMELLRGLDADQLVERFGPLSPARTVHILIQVCESLDEAHQAGLVHRDIKPANVYLCRRGTVHDFVKVLDFGLVKAAAGSGRAESALTQQHSATGTPAFMAPEVVMGDQNLDGRTDLYSTGCLAYWLLTGQLVFAEGNAVQIMYAHAQQPPVPPSQRTEQPIPPELEAIVMACLEKDRHARPASAEALRRQLEDLRLAGQWDRGDASRWWRAHVPEMV